MNRLIIVLVLTFTGYCLAADERVHVEGTTTASHAESDPHPHPALSVNPIWAGSLVILIAGMFLAAAVIGPAVRANSAEEYPAELHDHEPGPEEEDDPHSKHGHGHGHGNAGHH